MSEEEEKDVPTNGRATALRLWRSAAGIRWRLVVAAVAAVLYVATDLMTPVYAASLIDHLWAGIQQAFANGKTFRVTMENGGVDILDCEAISRVVSDLLDETDPIEGSYVFEVGSAGAERPLKRPADFEQFMGSQIEVKLYQPKDGRKAFVGVLAAYDNGRVTITSGKETLEFDKSQVAQVRLHATI